MISSFFKKQSQDFKRYFYNKKVITSPLITHLIDIAVEMND